MNFATLFPPPYVQFMACEHQIFSKIFTTQPPFVDPVWARLGWLDKDPGREAEARTCS